MSEQEIGVVAHYFDKIGVAAIALTGGSLSVGDTIHIKGAKTDVSVAVESIQIEHRIVQTAERGESVGIKIGVKSHEKDKVFKVTP